MGQTCQPTVTNDMEGLLMYTTYLTKKLPYVLPLNNCYLFFKRFTVY